MSSIRYAYHEAGHALLSRAFRRPLDVIAVGPAGGVTSSPEPLAADRSPEELEHALVIVMGGALAETYAPPEPVSIPAAERAEMNGGPDPYAGLLATIGNEGPTDHEVVEGYRERLGNEVVERARALAVELIERQHVIGRLELVADELYWRGSITGDELERILAA